MRQRSPDADCCLPPPAVMPRAVMTLRYVMIVGVFLMVGNLWALMGSLLSVSDISTPLRESLEAESAQNSGLEVAVMTDIIRAFDNLVIFLALGAFIGVFVVVARYTLLLWKGFRSGHPATYSTIASLAKLQLMVLALTTIGPALVFAGNEIVSMSPAFSVSMLLPVAILFLLRKPAVKEYFSVFELVRGPDLGQEAPAAQATGPVTEFWASPPR